MSTSNFQPPSSWTSQGLEAYFRDRSIPCVLSAAESPYLQTLRLIVSGACGRGCHHPDGSAVWCHEEGITDRRRATRTREEMLAAARYLHDRTGITKVKIAGLEPRFDESFVPFIQGLRSAGFSRISITTHDEQLLRHIEAYRDAGLTQLSVSIPHSQDAQFARITYSGTATGLLGLVQRACDLGLRPVKVNRVLQRGAIEDLPEVLAFVRRNDITVKLFELMWTHRAGEHWTRFHVPWTDLAHLWMDQVQDVSMHHYPRSYRTRVRFGLKGGGAIETNLMEDKRQAHASVCHTCPHTKVCAEGYLGCGIRVLPDLSVLPCLLRPELALDISDAVAASGSAPNVALEELVLGRPMVRKEKTVSQPVMIVRQT